MNAKTCILSLAATTAVAPLFAEALSVDFSESVGKVRPEIHSSGFGPTICSQTEQELADLKAMGFKYARTHDWALVNSNQRVCDYFHIFPLMRLDATEPQNYVFGPTDYLLKRTRDEMGAEIFFRLGTSIEHSGDKVHFNAVIPEDFDKLAETFAATVRHYNRGWADGFEWNIKYWEIWNEPDGRRTMWFPAGSSAGVDEAQRKALYAKFFVTVLKRLKGEFGDTIKVGGPASSNYPDFVDWIEVTLKACRDAGVAPDFISWHGYARDPMRYSREADAARKLCDSYGFPYCELILNEWHYFGENYNWADMQRCSDPAVKARIWDGPDSHNGIRSACFTLAALSNLERSKMTQAYFYGCGRTGSWAFKDALQRKYKVFYALKLFGDIVRDYTAICASQSAGTVTLFPVKDAAGRKGLLVTDYGGTSRRISVDVAGAAATAKAKSVLLDHQHDLVPHEVAFKDGKLELVKPDFHSAAFFVTFEE